MKIAVTGASGFIGRHAVDALVAGGHEVLLVGRSPPAQRRTLAFVESDLLAGGDPGWIARHRPSHLLHLAWYAEHGKFWTSPLNVDWCNATVRLISAFCEQGGERVVVAGSCAEYDWTSSGHCREGITPTAPATLYGVAKDCARRLAENICRRHEVPLAWGRIFVPFGPGESPRRLVPSVVEALLGRRPPFATCTQHWRDLLPVGDVAEGLAWLAGQPGLSGVFNVCSGAPTRIGALIEQLAAILERDPGPLLAASVDRSDSPQFLVGDNSLLLRAGWQPRRDLAESLRAYALSLAAPDSPPAFERKK